MLDVADNRDVEALEAAFALHDGEGVAEGLGRMLVLAVARVQDRAAEVARGERGGTAGRWRMTRPSSRS